MVYVNSVCVFPRNVTLKKGEWYYDAYAEVLPTNADIRSVTWHSEDTSVASVNASSGYIYANSAGTARIYATAKDGSGESDYITVTVTSGAIRVSSVCLNKSNLSLEKGNSYTLTATVYPTNASNQSLSWSSSNPSVATVSGGKVVAKAKGGAWITATAQDGSGESDSCYVTVTGNTLVTSVMVEPASKTMTVGDSTYLYEIVCPTNATNKSVEWSSNKTSVATVNPISGLVVAQGAGTAVITAAAQDGSGKKGSCTVRVEPPVAVECIQVSPKTKTMKVGETAYLDAIVCPVNATDKRVTWCSSNQNVACVDYYSGQIYANEAGTTVITATSVDGGYSDSAEITVVIDSVTIKRDGSFNKVIFNSTGKVWHCINHDMIYNEENMRDQVLRARRELNYLVNPGVIGSDIRTYTDEEIKLLYAIDPYGVADYVQRFAIGLFSVDGLKSVLGYKDYIFELLFKRKPKYFARTLTGVWYETEDKREITAVQSESETIFGMRPIWDGYTLKQIIEAAFDILEIALTITCSTTKVTEFLTNHKKVENIVKIFTFLIGACSDGVVSAIPDFLIGEALEDTSLLWAYNLVSVFSNINEIAQNFNNGQNYYQDIFNHCINDTDYIIYIELNSGQTHKLQDIKDALISC